MNNRPGHIPLIGALFVAEGLVTQEQLDACLLIQAQDYPGVPLGELLLRFDYIAQADLARVVGIQADIKGAIIETLETNTVATLDLVALLLSRPRDERLTQALNQLGVAVYRVDDCMELRVAWERQRHDMILIDSSVPIEDYSLLESAYVPTFFFPGGVSLQDRSAPLPHWIITLLTRFVAQVRKLQAQIALQERLRQNEFELNSIATMSRVIVGARSPHEAINRLMVAIVDLFDVEAGTLYRFDSANSQLIFEVVFGPHDEALYHRRLPIDRGIVGWVVRHGEPLLIPNVRTDPRFEGMFDHQTGFQTRSTLCVPMIALGEVRGAIQLINKLNGEFNERDLLLLRVIAAMGTLIGSLDWLTLEG